MRTFSELLREHIGRAGISDAELARAIGVQRQTIFRWKEGQVARPRSAEEVLRVASKLRLTPTERDELLLAAGFPPVDAPAPAAEQLLRAEAETDQPVTRADPVAVALPQQTAEIMPQRGARRPRILFFALIGLGALLLAAAIFLALRPSAESPQAARGETLILVAPFGNYTGGAQGYNVAGRLQEALEREVGAAGLKDARVAAWPQEVKDEAAAAAALVRSGAALFIWGEYDSGRVVARFQPCSASESSGRELALLAASPADLPAVINSALPGDIRYLALYSLAQVYLDSAQADDALKALGQAGLNLPDDKGTQAAHHFLVGYASQRVQPPDYDAAIKAYTDALALDPELGAALNNRAVAYLRRRGPGDLQTALTDLTQYLSVHADDADAYNNRGSAYLYLGGADNARRALADFDRAVALQRNEPIGYYNRALAYVRLDEGDKWRADLERAQLMGHAGAKVGLCWGYSLSEEPEQAVDYCRQAIDAGNAGSLENLVVAQARSGRFAEAADALARFRATNQGAAKAAELDAWLAALREGRDPFDGETLRRLREE